MWHLVHVGLELQLRARFASNTIVATPQALPQQHETRNLWPRPSCRQNISTPHSVGGNNGDVAFICCLVGSRWGGPAGDPTWNLCCAKHGCQNFEKTTSMKGPHSQLFNKPHHIHFGWLDMLGYILAIPGWWCQSSSQPAHSNAKSTWRPVMCSLFSLQTMHVK